MNTDEYMISRLRAVENSYDHFVDVTMSFIQYYGIGDELMDFIDNNPGVTSSDVIKERCRLVFGVEIP